MMDVSTGARNAVETCMAVQASDRVVVVTDQARRQIGLALAQAVESAGGTPITLVMEDFLSRPADHLPSDLESKIIDFKPTVSFFAATSLQGELSFRVPLMRLLIYGIKVRHGHMVGIDEQLMTEGMLADYKEISTITHKVNEAVKGAREIEVQAPSGTDMRAIFDPSKRRWKPCHGLYHEQGEWGNLPEGETFTSPMSVDGVMGAEVIGDHFSLKYGILDEPAVFEIAGGRVRKIKASSSDLQEELETYLGQHENSNRVGEYAIGTNIALKGLTGNLLQDEKLPGVHIAFGNPYPEESGADWTCPSHVDVVATRSTIKVDGQYLMKNGEFVL